MEKKEFPCKVEEVITAGGFTLDDFKVDQPEFMAYSTIYAPPFIVSAEAKLTQCKELILAISFTGELKAISNKLILTKKDLRIKLNHAEGYMNLTNEGLDVADTDMGLNEARVTIGKSNVEGMISSTRTFIVNLSRNETVLLTAGMSTEFIAELTELVKTIEDLNTAQNHKLNERAAAVDANMATFNELWAIISGIHATARAIYRTVDDVKLKKYTMSAIMKRVNAEGRNTIPTVPES